MHYAALSQITSSINRKYTMKFNLCMCEVMELLLRCDSESVFVSAV